MDAPILHVAGFPAPLTLADSMLPTLMMLAGIALLTMLIILNGRARRRRASHERLTPREKIERAKQTHAMGSDMRQMMVELEELTRRFSAQLDAKSMRLEKLLDEADAKIADLDKRLAAVPPVNGQPAARSTSGNGAAKVDVNGAASSSLPSPPPEPEPESEPVDPLARQIYQLADSGRNSRQIARELDEQIGKVELILALRQ